MGRDLCLLRQATQIGKSWFFSSLVLRSTVLGSIYYFSSTRQSTVCMHKLCQRQELFDSSFRRTCKAIDICLTVCLSVPIYDFIQVLYLMITLIIHSNVLVFPRLVLLNFMLTIFNNFHIVCPLRPILYKHFIDIHIFWNKLLVIFALRVIFSLFLIFQFIFVFYQELATVSVARWYYCFGI